jgi:hypothetical protein
MQKESGCKLKSFSVQAAKLPRGLILGSHDQRILHGYRHILLPNTPQFMPWLSRDPEKAIAVLPAPHCHTNPMAALGVTHGQPCTVFPQQWPKGSEISSLLQGYLNASRASQDLFLQTCLSLNTTREVHHSLRIIDTLNQLIM